MSPKGRVLLIEDDEWISTLLSKVLSDAGYEVALADTARRGFELCLETEPDCIVCDVTLPDIDGFWVARKVRTETSAVSVTPFLFLTSADDAESRLQGLNVGADAYLTKPFRNEEVIAQVGALIDMATRLQTQRDSFFGVPPSSLTAPAFRGDISQISVATMLTVIELERRTGRLKVHGPADALGVIEVVDGAIATVEVSGQSHEIVDGLRTILAWREGRYSFRSVALPGAAGKISVAGALLEAMRLEDEAKRG